MVDRDEPSAGRPGKEGRAEFEWYLSAMCLFKNEAPYLDEWLAFCVAEGIEHVVLYDNASTDNFREVLQPWIAAGIVELFEWPLHWESGAQPKAFMDALGRLRGRTRWAAFIDVDEYLFSPTGERVSEVLTRYEDHAGVIVNWQCYGTSGHKACPPGLTIENYTRRAKTAWSRNTRVKTIVDPSLAVEPRSAHLFKVAAGKSLVTDDFKPISVVRRANGRRHLRHVAAWLPYVPFDPYAITGPSIRQVSISNLRINHYVTRSEEEMALKYKDRDNMRPRDRRSYARYHNRNEVEDAVLAPRAGRIREIIARIRSLQGVAAP